MPTNFAAMSDSDINRWAAERDGWTVRRIGEYWDGVYYLIEHPTANWTPAIRQTNSCAWRDISRACKYATSAAACLSLLERWGYDWERRYYLERRQFEIHVSNLNTGGYAESVEAGVPFVRALLNAACTAKEAQQPAQAGEGVENVRD